jgi:diketogulonate reductase-like aldo/keto reductase
VLDQTLRDLKTPYLDLYLIHCTHSHFTVFLASDLVKLKAAGLLI